MSGRRVAVAFGPAFALGAPAAGQSIWCEKTLSNALRQRRANQRCDGCEDRPGAVHLVADSPLLTDAWLAGRELRGPNPANADNKAAIADFWYDGVSRRIFTRSAVFHEVDDPADVRLGRAPGT